ncbi:MAG: ATP-binding protein [Vicinamibacterales bacterium]
MRISTSLTNRIFLACTLLVTLALALAFAYLYWRTSRDTETDLARELQESSVLMQEYQASLTDTFGRMTRMVADLPKLKAAVETADPPTIQPLADEYLARIGADTLILTGRSGVVLATSGVVPAQIPAPASQASLDEHSAFWPHDRGLLEITSVPILLDGTPPDILGRLTVGFLLDDARARQFKRLTGSDFAFLVSGRVVASTIDVEDAATLTTLSPAGLAGTPPPFARTLRLHGEDFLATSRPLALDPAAVDNSLAPSAVVLRSRTERMRLLSTIRSGLSGALIVAVLLAAVLSYVVARTMTRPLSAITTAMRDIALTGDLTRKVTLTHGDWHDEDARVLATTFNTLTDSIATFQREEAQRERLSALGRLSTVIAHEVRNPLMIIRAALRSLRRGEASPAERREALDDIDEETSRLNRIVSDVLDFARPIHFERREVDINTLCRTSVDAAWVDAPAGSVTLDLDPRLPVVTTDAERVRTALVNILTNARYAVAASTGPDAGASELTEAGVQLTTRHDDDGVQVTIRDRGVGISADDMAHIFDPYFTTRRGGTGLGLPIAKNIVEGLGGRIEVTSIRGEGTELRITLPTNAGAPA